LDKAFADPRVQEEDIFGTVEWQGKQLNVLKSPIRLSARKKRVFHAPPDPGQETDEIASKLLGYSNEKIKRLREKGVIA
jgi:crotonobetainyl-CoA:carnitine CoA-transferase CaiB-like acyl-CoA transferase